MVEGGEVDEAESSEGGCLFSDVSFVSHFSVRGKQLEAFTGIYGDACVDKGGFRVVDSIAGCRIGDFSIGGYPSADFLGGFHCLQLEVV